MDFSLNKIPLIRLLIPFILGIVAAVYFCTASSIPFYCFLFLLSLYLIFVFIKKINSYYNTRWLFGILIYTNSFLAGYNITSFKTKDSKSFNNISNKEQLFIGVIDESPQEKNKTIKVVLNTEYLKNQHEWEKAKNKVILYLEKDSLSQSLSIADMIAIKTNLKFVSPPKNPNEFDYQNYLSNHFIYHYSYLKNRDWFLIQQAEENNLFKIASTVRNYLIKSLEKKGLNKNELAIASALILGYKNKIDIRLKKAYSSAGAMHVLAVSGLHVGVIYLLFNFLLVFLDKKKYGNYIKSGLLLFILWSYALITGFSPSILRATTMFSFIVIGKLLNRNNNIFNTLAASALVLLIINPLYIMEVGFQLSYAAVIGIIVIQPFIYNIFNTRWWLLDKIWEITAVSIAAQIATFPLALLYFHQFPNYFILSNLMVIPLAITILYLGILTISCLSIPIISDYLIIALKHLIQFLNWSVINIERLPYSLSNNIRFNILDTWLIYSLIITIILLVLYRKFKFLVLACISSILFLSSVFARNYQDIQQRKIFVYNITQHTAINFLDGNSSILLTDKELINKKEKLLYHIQNNWINRGIKNKENVPLYSKEKKRYLNNHLFKNGNFFQFYNLKALLIDQNFEFSKIQDIKVDLVILSNNSTHSIVHIIKSFHPKEIIIDSSNSKQLSEKIMSEAYKLGVKCHSIAKDGAFIKSIYL